MEYAIVIHKTGGAEVMQWEAHASGEPAPGEVLLRHEAIGLNFIDIYHRTGLYPLTGMPAVIGMEGAGTVVRVGQEVQEFSPGDRVAYASPPPGAYAQQRLIPAHRLVKLPDDITFTQAAAMMLKGMTARYLLHGCYPVGSGDTILMHAAAGGVGTILTQWAHSLGARVIGTVGSEEKAEIARSHGCDHPVLYRKEDFVDRVSDLTDGRGVDVVYDGVGQATFLKSLDCLRPMGTLVSFGQSSGAIPAFDPALLGAKGSLFLTRPSLMTYTAKREDLLAHARDLFDVVTRGVVRIEIGQTYPLAEAARAHKDLETRQTSRATVLIP
ncbi:MAG: quinone oxidoreductase [Desulfosarcinaceae bacterium]